MLAAGIVGGPNDFLGIAGGGEDWGLSGRGVARGDVESVAGL